MNSHFRNCPKHRKPLPCQHCALIAAPAPAVASNPAPESVVEESYNDQLAREISRRGEPVPVSVEPDADRKRRLKKEHMQQLRKERSEARRRAKEKAQKPWQERVDEDRVERKFKETWEQAQELGEKNRAREADILLSGKAQSVWTTTGSRGADEIEIINAAHETDTGRVTPLGAGAREHEAQEVDGSTPMIDGDSNSPHPKSTRDFSGIIKGITHENDKARTKFERMVGTFENGVLNSSVVEFVPDSDIFRCRICWSTFDWWTEARRHFGNAAEAERLAYNSRQTKRREVVDALSEMFVPPNVTIPEEMMDPVRQGRHMVAFEQGKVTGQHAR